MSEREMRWQGAARGLLVLWLFHLGGLALGQEPQITRGPYLQALLSTSTVVVWLTDQPSLGQVRYTAGGAVFKSAVETEVGYVHRLKLTGLSPGTVYLYQILDGERVLTPEAFPFRTSPLPGQGSFRAAVIGDSGSGSLNQRAVAAVIRDLRPDLLLHTGDIVYLRDLEEVVFSPYREVMASACFYPSKGNHDDVFDWRELFIPPMENPDGSGTYYSFDWGSAHLVALDTEGSLEADSLQMEWLRSDLGAPRAPGIAWTILFFHKPPYTVGEYYLENLELRELVGPVADLYGVDLVLNGHDHNYQRSHPIRGQAVHDAWQDPSFVSPKGTIYLVSGGGGQSLYSHCDFCDLRFNERFVGAYHALELEVSPKRLSVRAISSQNEVLDQFTISKEGPRPEFTFIRGDLDLNGRLDIADPINILAGLFGGQPFECPAVQEVVADVDRSGLPADIADPIYLLNYLFLGGSPPAHPFPACGPLAQADDSWCVQPRCR